MNEKNLQFFYDYRAVNGFYIYGGRKNVRHGELSRRVRQAAENDRVRDQRIWAVAQGKSVPATIDDSTPASFRRLKPCTAAKPAVHDADRGQQTFKLADGYEVNLFASEVEFPDLHNPVAIAFDARGRLWVATMATFPMYLPGKPVDDKI